MSGTVAPERSEAPEWGKWLIFTVLFLLSVLLVSLVSLANGSGTVFVVSLLVGLLFATLVIPVWAIYGLDTSDE